jgi:predicted RNA-binding protein with PUA-like domain
MAYWLLKTEPSTYSYSDLERDGKTVWDGVTNNLALKHIRSMARGDLAFVYHTGNEKAIVGIAEVASAPYPDPKKKQENLVVVDLKPKRRLQRPISLSDIKARKEFAQFALVRLPRLSVMPVADEIWHALLGLSK